MNPQPFPPDTADAGSTYGDDASLSNGDGAGGAKDSGTMDSTKGTDSDADAGAGDGGLDAPIDVVVDALLDAEDSG